MSMDAPTDVDAIIIGAGFSGLAALHELRDRLRLTVRLLEAGTDVGGVWNWNRYPGARCDSDSFVYCFSFSKEIQDEWDWSERFAGQPEIHQYLRHLADRLDMRRDIQFQTFVRAAVYDEATSRWTVHTDKGETLQCTYLISAVGPLSAVHEPPFEGIDSFQGELHLAPRWPVGGVDFTGKRVAIVGTGATGIQMTPIVAQTAGHLTVFQRSPQWVIPARNRSFDDGSRQEIKSTYDEIWAQTRRQGFGLPLDDTDQAFAALTIDERQQRLERAWELGGFRLSSEVFADVMVNEESNETVAEFVRTKIRAIVKDQDTAELLAPKGQYTRPQLGHHYYETFNRENVSLVDVKRDPIQAITPRGLRTTAGEYEFEVIVLALGFDGGTGAVTQIDIQGRDGQTIKEKWRAGPRTYLGIGVDGFPNFFMSYGPQSCFANAPAVSEQTAQWIGQAINFQRENGYRLMEPTADAVESWVQHVSETYYGTTLKDGEGTRSWLVGANIPGKPKAPLLYLGSAPSYFDRIQQEADSGFGGFTTQPGGVVATAPA